ncbi:hypothetical protein MUY14_18065 [Amycolatopsis sp. FBCC-B4732]|uniref:hypothetical protein n=1 Tax=Amycolatopsis sp. FBCC-B4732 TaxID=3079339 RepID=UPI001FF65BB0|nr:hypothetical protein [Amycolatopsis sp. FBCC-B4732]UOX92430.1 hypothetical protein MUY14_18065 [Amycolatopsis sp. FBCC-B4732]
MPTWPVAGPAMHPGYVAVQSRPAVLTRIVAGPTVRSRPTTAAVVIVVRPAVIARLVPVQTVQAWAAVPVHPRPTVPTRAVAEGAAEPGEDPSCSR